MQRILFFLICLIIGSSFRVWKPYESLSAIKLLTSKVNFEVGSEVTLKFATSDTLKPLLYCTNSYGATLVAPLLESNRLTYNIPQNIANKIGVVHWKLLQNEGVPSGTFTMYPKSEVATMETYIGPPSISAGGIDYTMLVVIPTDSLDNPMPVHTLVKAKHQFLDLEKNDTIYTKNLIAYKNIYSKIESGRMLVSSESLGTNSKEFTVDVSAAIPTNFNISVKRPHDYADGNQITTFTTSVIRDKQGNVVSEGTFVTFFIKNSKGNVLKTSGITISGVATAKMIHPDYEDYWTIKAYVRGMAESNVLHINYKQVIKDFKVSFSKNNRVIQVGPLQSFMQQLIPDGLQVTLKVYKDSTLVETQSSTSYKGFVDFKLKPFVFENGNYTLRIETAGRVKSFKSKNLW